MPAAPNAPLALAGACAALLLLAASAAPYGDKCVHISMGNKSRTMVTVHLEDVVEQHVTIDIPHRCELTPLVGQLLAVCDDAVPEVVGAPWPTLAPFTVRRRGVTAEPACAVAYQYYKDIF